MIRYGMATYYEAQEADGRHIASTITLVFSIAGLYVKSLNKMHPYKIIGNNFRSTLADFLCGTHALMCE